jgi:hypothetical protein
MHIINKRLGLWWTVLGISILSTACSQNRKNFPGPQGYDMNKPHKIVMPQSLHEISGIAFYKGNADTIYAEQDEEGKLFYLKAGDRRSANFKFSRSGDYEDVAICNNYVIILKSNGTLFSFPFSDIRTTEVDNIKEWKGLLPEGEYEGMYADEKNNFLYVLCKHCADQKTSKTAKGYILQLGADGTISQNSSFAIDVRDIESLTGSKKINFHPSALGNNPRTGEWYIVSSVNKLLVITDSYWKVKEAYKLNPALYIQPEGIAFDKDGNLYISNEGGDIHAGNVLKIRYSGK